MSIRHFVLILIIMLTPFNVHAQKRNEETVLDLGQNNGLCLVSIPAGKFLMGPAPKENRPNDPKTTQKEVEIAKSFRMENSRSRVANFEFSSTKQNTR